MFDASLWHCWHVKAQGSKQCRQGCFFSIVCRYAWSSLRESSSFSPCPELLARKVLPCKSSSEYLYTLKGMVLSSSENTLVMH